MKQPAAMNRSQRERWLDTAIKYGGREVDWNQINQYARTHDDGPAYNHQYDYDYPQPETGLYRNPITRQNYKELK